MRKIPSEYENPLDDLLISISELLNPIFNIMGLTPNLLTTISGIFGLLSVKYLYENNYTYFAATFILSYFFDCCDGNYAREYNMVTDFGDMYDHIKDGIVNILVVILMMYKFNIRRSLIIFVILFVIFYTSCCVHIGCQERQYEDVNEQKEGGQFLSYFKQLCSIKSNIKYTRFVGTGTFILFMVVAGWFSINKNY